MHILSFLRHGVGRIVLVSVLALLFCHTFGAAQLFSPFGAGEEYYNFRNVTLPIDVKVIQGIKQDRSGLMWFATRGGLFSYNGYTLRTFRIGHDTAGNVINDIVQTGDRTLFLATDGGLRLFDLATHTFSTPKGLGGRIKNVRALAVQGDVLWIGTHNDGLYRFDMKTHRLAVIKNFSFVNALVADGGTLYVGTLNGLGRVNANSVSWVNRLPVLSLCLDRRTSLLYVGTDGKGLHTYNIATGMTKALPVAAGNSVKSVAVNGDTVYVGTDAGLYIIEEGKQTQHIVHDSRRPRSLCGDVLGSVFVDRDGDVWFGTDRGVSLLAVDRGVLIVPLIDITRDGRGNIFSTILRRADGTYWLGGENGVIHVGSGPVVWYSVGDNIHSLRHNHIRRLFEDSDGHLWIASDGGAARLNADGVFTYYNITNKRRDSDSRWCYDYYDDGRGRLWVASYFGGVFVVDKRKFGGSDGGYVVADTTIVGCPVYQLESLDGNTLVANTQNGIALIDVNSLAMRYLNAYDDNMTVFRGEMWYSSEGRLYRMRRDGHKREVAYERGSCQRIHTLVPTPDHLWLSTADGLFRYDAHDGTVRKYAAPHADFLAGYYDEREQMLVWGGTDCIVPMKIDSRSTAYGKSRVVAVTSITQSDSLLSEGRGYRTLYKRKGVWGIELLSSASVTLELSNFNYSQSPIADYWYAVDGNDKWSKLPNGQNTLSLAGLSGGRHTLRLSDCNPAIDDNAAVSIVEIVVPYPWYASRLAIAVYVLFAIVLIVAVVAISHRRNRRRYERRERERFLELSSLKMDFFVNISHELKTPLSLVIAPLEKLINETKDVKSKNTLATVRQNALRLNTLIGKILDFKRIEYESEDTLMCANVDLCQIARNCIDDFAAVCRQRSVAITFSADCEPMMMQVDVLKIESVLINLLSNAIKHVPNETGRINVGLRSVGNDVEMTVHDNGPGIAERDLPSVFLRYFSADASNGGNGIGLHIVKKFVELHGGTVSARNDGGFVVTVRLPMHTAEVATVREQSEEKEYATAVGKAIILVIDDNSEMVDFLTEALSPHYTCMSAFDGISGIEKMSVTMPDLVIVDQMMPRMDGMTFVRRLRRNVPTATIPIIMLTAKDDYATEMASIDNGVDVFISKPFDLHKLMLQVARLLKKCETIEQCNRMREIASPHFADTAPSESGDEVLLRRITDSIERNMAREGFSVETLAAETGVSTKQLYRKVKQLTGMSPVSYIRKVRLRKAHALLQQPGLTVQEVMYMVGMQNASYFAKCFAEEYGMAPAAYAKQCAEDSLSSGL